MKEQREIKLKPISTQRASEAIYQQISDMIISGEISPGDRLPSERAMMEMLGRSRPTIREALRMLERNGLIKTIPGSRGAVVVAPGTTSVEEPLEAMIGMNLVSNQELLEYRMLNEIAAAGWAAERRTVGDQEKLKDLLDAFDPDSVDYQSFSELDIAFHQAIAEAGHNRVVSMVDRVIHRLVAKKLQDAYSKKNSTSQRTMMKEIWESHREIYSAIADRDPEAARAAMERHMNMFEKDLDL